MPQPDPRLNLTGQGYCVHLIALRGKSWFRAAIVSRSQHLGAQRLASSPGAPVQAIGQVATAVFLQRLSSDATALSLHRQEMAPQIDAVPVDLVVRFAALERREGWVCKVASSNPQQFRQPIYAAGQNFQLGHLRFSFDVREATFSERWIGISPSANCQDVPRTSDVALSHTRASLQSRKRMRSWRSAWPSEAMYRRNDPSSVRNSASRVKYPVSACASVIG